MEAQVIFVVTREHNDYDQHGDYLVAVYLTKPTYSQLLSLLHEDSSVSRNVYRATARHLLNGGGRQGTEDVWYNLKELKEGELYDTSD
jgi:hypothetical protein